MPLESAATAEGRCPTASWSSGSWKKKRARNVRCRSLSQVVGARAAEHRSWIEVLQASGRPPGRSRHHASESDDIGLFNGTEDPQFQSVGFFDGLDLRSSSHAEPASKRGRQNNLALEGDGEN